MQLAKRNYEIYDKELLAIVKALSKYRTSRTTMNV